MKKLPGWASLAAIAIAAVGLYAQHGAESGTPAREEAKAAERGGESPSHGEHGNLEIWKWANFALLAGALGYLVKKNAGPYFAARNQKIRGALLDAADLRKEAEARAAEIDRRLAGLEREIAALREEAGREETAESERMRQDTAADIAKVQAHAEQEIAAAGKAARMELRRYSAALAVALAEKKIQARMGPEAQDALVRGFIRELPGSARSAQST